uniref:Uncharacterized protein n=1 Tax=Neobodo designis TaxID=312471 RepID=A0A7S1QHD0_NEODS|mmetsp:Transcript_46262/g.142694  ORF Transcript_46262/g.142694 Transcript_46262/m.142694 type:complete len:319 (+) Transcript_46262:38-994(+)|eukprot:CAMPEP_0174832476 /NCGR_PEP_ID=MMETSP1114-20130205/3697_1 /TAXON_ID=312471 /ORGANISM="Neobodo designis, Strain CCAP 1951/1" /LENGTH=318 /DNA_ID=CAMNT_0016066335 /DNA_START=35 /DNA_END=991 /DNA_ORIENTATION=-
MLTTLFWGSVLQAYGPLVVMMFAVLAFHPTLAVLAMASAFVSLVPIQMTSFVYMLVIASHGGASVSAFDSNAANAADSGRGWIVVCGVIFQELTRLALAYGVVRAEWFFRTHHQVLFASRFRLLPVGAACGFGMAATLSLLQFGALLQAIEALGDPGVSVVNDQAVLWERGTCPQLPFVFFQALSWCFMSVCHVSWSAVMTTSVAALVDNGTLGPSTAPVENTSPIPPRFRAPIPRPTTLRPTDGRIAIFMVIVLHFIASTVSLVNSDAFDITTAEAVAGRGCITTLPVQATVMIASIALAWAAARLDVCKRVDSQDL